MNVYQIENVGGTNKALKNISKIDLDNELYAMASNSVDKLAVGGDLNKVDIHTISQGAITAESLASPYLAMQFSSKIQRIQWVGGRYVIGYPENDSEVQIFNTETETVLRLHLDNNTTPKNGALDPLFKYFAVTTNDGHLEIFTLPDAEDQSNQGKAIKKIKITNAKGEALDKNPLEIQWTHDGTHLLVSGENTLGIVDTSSWELNYSKDIGHKKPMTCIAWLSETVIATAGLDNVIKIFDFSKRTLLHYISTQY